MSKLEERRSMTLPQIFAALALIATFLGTGAGIVAGFTTQGVKIQQHEKKIARLELQAPIVNKIEVLVDTINDAIAESRVAWKLLIKKSDEADKELSRKVTDLRIGLNELKSKVNNSNGREKISYQEPE